MGDDLNLPGRISVRTPMQWTSDTNGGFSEAPQEQLVRQLITSGPYSVKKVNAEAQQHDQNSLLNWMKRLILMRRHCLEVGWGAPRVIKADQPHVLVHSYAWKENVLVFAHNLSAKPCRFTISSRRFHPSQFVDIFSDRDYELTGEGTVQLELEAYGYRWFRVNQLKTKQ
ncbi:alpha-glucosidase C-terminal domain-containing protein [Pontibacter korlensis]|uniref:alpha-glucosidase C-terminal domain-containing protein n=1 Tax=Pontibacter korlensis TaxID=400092 RepID=UPI000AA58682|nr:alpha-glucosidase C-terminal domain-containing protein [Pontibacter korlensis]